MFSNSTSSLLVAFFMISVVFTGCIDEAEKAEETLPDEVKCLLILGEYEILDLEITPAEGMSSGDENVVKGHIKFSDSEYDADTEKCNISYNIVDADGNLHVNPDHTASYFHPYEYMAEISGNSSNMVIIDTGGSIILGDDIEEYSGSLENSGNITLSGIAVLVPCTKSYDSGALRCFNDATRHSLVVYEGLQCMYIPSSCAGLGCIDYEDTNDNGLYDEGEPCNDDALTSDIAKLNEQLANQTEQNNNLSEQLQNSNEDNSELLSAIANFTAQIQSLNEQMQNETEDNDDLTSEIANLTAQIENLNEQIVNLTKETERLKGYVFQPETWGELKTAVDEWIEDTNASTVLSNYGYINFWDTSLITDMSSLFAYNHTFNADISNWDVSSVTDMRAMFFRAYDFNGNISDWDVSSVTDMEAMFRDANSFNQDLSDWDVSSVTDMYSMFSYATSFNQDISDWNVSSVTDMSYMFNYADDLSDNNKCAIHTSFDSNDNWDYDWEESCPFQPEDRFELKSAVDEWIADSDSASSTYGDINTWDTSLITDMSELFYYEQTFNDEISNWDVSSVTDMSYMFYGTNFNQDI